MAAQAPPQVAEYVLLISRSRCRVSDVCYAFPVPTPFASHAFHPLDGYLQSVPYHLFIFLFPIQRHLYLGLFVAVNFWYIFIHDSDMITGHPLEKVINGPAHHTLHHLYFTVNYGQVRGL